MLAFALIFKGCKAFVFVFVQMQSLKTSPALLIIIIPRRFYSVNKRCSIVF